MQAIAQLFNSGIFHIGNFTVKWKIPKIDRSLNFLLSRTSEEELQCQEATNSLTLALHYITFTINFGKWMCVNKLDDNHESIWYGFFIHADSLSAYLGKKGHKLFDFPWQVRVIEPFKEYQLDHQDNLKYHDKPNECFVGCKVNTYYLKVLPIALHWIPFLHWKVYRANIVFDQEVGDRVGTWKGGTLEVSFMLPEKMSPYDALEFYAFGDK